MESRDDALIKSLFHRISDLEDEVYEIEQGIIRDPERKARIIEALRRFEEKEK